MARKIFLVILAVFLLLGALPVRGFAQEVTAPSQTEPTQAAPPQTEPAETTPPQTEVPPQTEPVPDTQTPAENVPVDSAEGLALRQAAKDAYVKTQQSTGMVSLNGYCGRMVSHQLVHMGINTGLVTNHGKKQYDMYAKMRRTSGGKYINTYPVADYTLEEALNAISQNGTKPVYNILVGFEWTNTKAGGKYGHACVISGILDGKVYFMESFDTKFAPEGEVNVCTIQEFSKLYGSWTQFEGVIHFADSYVESCKHYGTDLFVRARFDMLMRSAPALVGDEGCKTLRKVSAGEQLRVIEVVENPQRERYYKVKEKGRVGYIVAQAAVLERTNAEDITIRNLKLKKSIKAGTKEALSGAIYAENGLVSAVEAVILDAAGKEVARKREITDSKKVVLSEFAKGWGFKNLTEGQYTVTVSAETASAYVREDQLDYSYETVLLAEKILWVGKQGQSPESKAVSEEVKDGWYLEKGVWHCYENGQPRTGWYDYRGMRYYLKDSGKVTTGKAKIEGIEYYFTDTGILHTGWLRSNSGMRYYSAQGGYLTGWQEIDNGKFYFSSKGYLQTKGTRTDGDVKYKFRSDGRAVATT